MGRRSCSRRSKVLQSNYQAQALFLVALLSIVVAHSLVAARSLTEAEPREARIKKFDFEVNYKTIKRICNTTRIVAVNDQFPGPTIRVREGDRVIVTVHNYVEYNLTIHWHGVDQRLSAWSDGTAYITQCPIQPNQSYTYDFTLVGQAGSVWWHAHSSWLRYTVYGAFIIEPNRDNPYPYQHLLKDKIFKDEVIHLGDAWAANVEDLATTFLEKFSPPARSLYGLAINGQPGPMYPCSEAGTYRLKVRPGKTYLLRLYNVAFFDDFLFAIANHSMTVVEVDGAYTKPYTTSVLFISPGQSTSVWITADQPASRSYTMLGASYDSNPPIAGNRSSAIGVFEYEGSSWAFTPASNQLPLVTPSNFPALTDSNFVDTYLSQIKGAVPHSRYNSLPLEIDRSLFFAFSINALPCPSCNTTGFVRDAASVNNVSFVTPTSTAILPAYYYNRSADVYTTDFPDAPPLPYNYTNPPPQSPFATPGTKVTVLEFGCRVQIVLQGTANLVGPTTHPIHMHGHSFYVVASGVGNFNDASKGGLVTMNLVDPPLRNTAVIPTGGWTVIRFVADNPGVWFLHCHLELHLSWGMSMLFIVKDGTGPLQTLPPPPADYPKC